MSADFASSFQRTCSFPDNYIRTVFKLSDLVLVYNLILQVQRMSDEFVDPLNRFEMAVALNNS